ncbi:YmL10 [Exophiala xenobiotica]|nr:YmL10 [Exophiala xenobiotica]
MPPRLPLRLVQAKAPTLDRLYPTSTTTSIASFLLPFLHTQSRNASILSSLSDRPGAYNRRIRRGRGPASGNGGKSGRGSDGQKQHGKVPAGFNGGQTPEHIVHGKYGFVNLHATEMAPVNLDKIQNWIDQGRLNPSKPITLVELCRSGLAIRRIKAHEMHPFISMRWDPVAIEKPALAAAGGMSLEERVAAMGFKYRLPDPANRSDIEYYRNAKNRGYLSHTVKEGEGPSLYFKPPISEEELKALKKARAKSGVAKAKEENKLW